MQSVFSSFETSSERQHGTRCRNRSETKSGGNSENYGGHLDAGM